MLGRSIHANSWLIHGVGNPIGFMGLTRLQPPSPGLQTQAISEISREVQQYLPQTPKVLAQSPEELFSLDFRKGGFIELCSIFVKLSKWQRWRRNLPLDLSGVILLSVLGDGLLDKISLKLYGHPKFTCPLPVTFKVDRSPFNTVNLQLTLRTSCMGNAPTNLSLDPTNQGHLPPLVAIRANLTGEGEGVGMSKRNPRVSDKSPLARSIPRQTG